MTKSDVEKKFFELYERESDSLFRFVFFRVSDREVAKDLVQESFVKLWEVMISKKIIDNPRAFLFRIASNKVIDRYRKAKEYSLDLLAEDGFDAPTEMTVSIEERIDANEALEILRELPEKYREAVWLRNVEEWTVKDIAKHLDESENVVSVRIYRGVKLWKERLKKESVRNFPRKIV
jgi:RNA polymerase sigma-70 factor (ECF subfamily)